MICSMNSATSVTVFSMLFNLSAVEMLVTGFVAKIAPRLLSTQHVAFSTQCLALEFCIHPMSNFLVALPLTALILRRSAIKTQSTCWDSGAESKDPDDVSPCHAASGSSHDIVRETRKTLGFFYRQSSPAGRSAAIAATGLSASTGGLISLTGFFPISPRTASSSVGNC